MSCNIMFTPGKLGVRLYACGCGWSGKEPKYTLVPHSWREPTCYGVSPSGKVRPVEYVTYTNKGDMDNPFETSCPDCGAKLKEESVLVFDIGSGSRTVTKKYESGKSWNKEIRTVVPELRMQSDPKNLAEFTAEKSASAILWEVLRCLEPEMPSKPKWNDFNSKGEYFAAKDANRKWWANVYSKEYTIAQLYVAKMAKDLSTAKEQTRAILIGLGIDLNKAKMSSKFKFVSMASKLADSRKKAYLAITKRVMSRLPLSVLLEKAAERSDLEEVTAILLGLYNEFGDIVIRSTAVKAIMRNRYDMWCVKEASYKAFEKSTWKYREWIAAHPEFYENPEFYMDRGTPVTEEDGSVWAYDPVWGGMMQIAALPKVEIEARKKGQTSFKLVDMVPYSESYSEDVDVDEDSWQTDAAEGEDEVVVSDDLDSEDSTEPEEVSDIE